MHGQARGSEHSADDCGPCRAGARRNSYRGLLCDPCKCRHTAADSRRPRGAHRLRGDRPGQGHRRRGLEHQERCEARTSERTEVQSRSPDAHQPAGHEIDPRRPRARRHPGRQRWRICGLRRTRRGQRRPSRKGKTYAFFLQPSPDADGVRRPELPLIVVAFPVGADGSVATDYDGTLSRDEFAALVEHPFRRRPPPSRPPPEPTIQADQAALVSAKSPPVATTPAAGRPGHRPTPRGRRNSRSVVARPAPRAGACRDRRARSRAGRRATPRSH